MRWSCKNGIHCWSECLIYCSVLQVIYPHHSKLSEKEVSLNSSHVAICVGIVCSVLWYSVLLLCVVNGSFVFPSRKQVSAICRSLTPTQVIFCFCGYPWCHYEYNKQCISKAVVLIPLTMYCVLPGSKWTSLKVRFSDLWLLKALYNKCLAFIHSYTTRQRPARQDRVRSLTQEYSSAIFWWPDNLLYLLS